MVFLVMAAHLGRIIWIKTVYKAHNPVYLPSIMLIRRVNTLHHSIKVNKMNNDTLI